MKIICEDRIFDRAGVWLNVKQKLAREIVNNSHVLIIRAQSFAPKAFSSRIKIQIRATSTRKYSPIEF